MVLGKLSFKLYKHTGANGFSTEASVGQLGGLPPALIIVDENDILR